MRKSVKLLFMVSMCSSIAIAHAQEGPEVARIDVPATGDEDGARVDVITVTATRRESSIQEVPLAVTAVAGADLDRQQITDFTSLSRLAPSLTASAAQSPTNSNVLNIRGVGTTSNNLGFESAVGIFIDGAYQSRPGVALSEFVDVERVEVLRGPQGTLFGRNTSAGAVTITTKSPDLDELGGFVNATLGNYELGGMQGAINVPIIQDKLAVRLTGAFRNRDGFVTSLDGQTESNNLDQALVRGQVKYVSDLGTSVRLVADYSESDTLCCAPIELSRSPFEEQGIYAAVGLGQRGGADQPSAGQAALDDGIASADIFPFSDIEQWGITGEINHPLTDNMDLVYIGSYRDFQSLEGGDFDFVGADVASTDFIFNDLETMTQELRVQGRAFGGRLDFLIGGFYSTEDISQDSQTTLRSEYDSYIAAFTFPFTEGALGSTPLTVLSGGITPEGASTNNIFSQESTSWSVFTHNTFEVTSAFDVTVGLRYVDEQKDGVYRQLGGSNGACAGILGNLASIDEGLQPLAVGLGCLPFVTPADLPGSGVPGGLPTPATFDETFEDDALVYTIKAAYELVPLVNGYVSYTRGYKAGGFNFDTTAAINGADPRFGSEGVDSYEVGVKSVLFDGRLLANGTLFHQEFEDLQVLEFTGIQFETFNVPEARTTGVELEFNALVTDQFSMNGGVTYVDARYPDDCAGNLTSPTVTNLCGETLTNAPETVAVLAGTYERDLTSRLSAFLTASVRYESERRTATQATPVGDDDTPLPFDIQEANTKANMRAGITAPDGNWAAEAWVTNLTDERTVGVTFDTTLRPGSRSGYLQEPRTYGITIRKSF